MPPPELSSADDRPPVSVVIATHDRAAGVARAIQSVLAQQWPLEIIVVDDRSSDDTPEVVARQLDPRIRYERLPRRLGAGTARSHGIAVARHAWVALLDSDDQWLPGKLELQMAALLRDPGRRQLAYHAVIAQGASWACRRPLRGLDDGERVGDYLFREDGLIQTSTMCARRQLFLECGFDPTLPCHQDWDLCLRMEAAGVRFTWVPQALTIWSCGRDRHRLSARSGDAASRRWLEGARAALSPAAYRSLRAELAVVSARTFGRRAGALPHVLVATLTGASSVSQAARFAVRLALSPTWVDHARRALHGDPARQVALTRRANEVPVVPEVPPCPPPVDGRPLVSVVVPVLNDERGIATCLDALLRQTYPPDRCEIIVADNGSSDGTRAVVARLAAASGGRVRLMVETTTRSSYAARNRALREVRGEVVAFTDADCIPAKEWIEEGVRALEQQGRGTVAGRVIFTYRGDRPNAYEYWDSAVHLDQEAFVRRYGFGATANLFIHARTLAQYGPFRSDLVSGGDREFGYRLWIAGEPVAYAVGACVLHPARATFRGAIHKTIRLARAHGPLHDLGVFASRFECLRRFRPYLGGPRPRTWEGRLSWADESRVLVLRNLHAWLIGLVCIGQRVADGLRGRQTAEQPSGPDAR